MGTLVTVPIFLPIFPPGFIPERRIPMPPVELLKGGRIAAARALEEASVRCFVRIVHRDLSTSDAHYYREQAKR